MDVIWLRIVSGRGSYRHVIVDCNRVGKRAGPQIGCRNDVVFAITQEIIQPLFQAPSRQGIVFPF